MRAALALALAPLLAACAAAPAPAPSAPGRGIALRNPGFESERVRERCPWGWDCTAHADPGAYRFRLDDRAPGAGKRSLCIERVKGEPWGSITQGRFDGSLAGKRVRFSILARVEGAGEGAGPMAVVHDGSGRLLAHGEKKVRATQGWERLALELAVPAGAVVLEVGAVLEGPGRLCMDDARLEVLAAGRQE